MVLAEFARRHTAAGMDFVILATDASRALLEFGRTAVYPEACVGKIPSGYRGNYLRRHRDPSRGRVRIIPEIRKKVMFRLLNLMDGFDIQQKLDVVFCRNVIIYFDRATQEGMLRRLCRELKGGGYLFLGHSESLSRMDLPLEPAATAVYRKTP